MITPSVIFLFHLLTAGKNILCFSILIAGLNRFTTTLITVDLPDTTAGDMRGWTGGRPVPSRPLTPPFPSASRPLTPLPPLPPSSLIGAARASPAQNVPPFPPPFSSPPAPHLLPLYTLSATSDMRSAGYD